MAWIESHQTVWEHAKTRKAARRLHIPPVQLVGHLHALWHWSLDHAEDGNVSKYDAEDLAIAARWDGDPDEFVTALTDCGPGDSAGYLERGGHYGDPSDELTGDLVLHDWWDYAGKLIEWRRRDRRRKARSRAATPPTPAPPPSGGRPADVPQATGRTAGTREPTEPTNRPPSAADASRESRREAAADTLADIGDALADACHLHGRLTRRARDQLATAAVDLRRVGATPAAIRGAAGRYRRTWPDADLTPLALAKHWPRFARDGPPATPSVPRCPSGAHPASDAHCCDPPGDPPSDDAAVYQLRRSTLRGSTT